ncbi:LysM peptidoglycan-binding domain-containing protein [Caldibacillus thermolactis]|uniref:LysM peptidoglycan-binding domain-containing protein n=1 Tax=Pallidibacillus thermolactis TaxID=251051 RepID=A0ABT2WP68_9BACI|nr:LysM peptidoglycan-binding domain-containing protein [Pallidibacillus thermolactis]
MYTVKDGDTLWDIAEKYNTKISVIIKSNNLSDEKIIPGQKLIISNRSS